MEIVTIILLTSFESDFKSSFPEGPQTSAQSFLYHNDRDVYKEKDHSKNKPYQYCNSWGQWSKWTLSRDTKTL